MSSDLESESPRRSTGRVSRRQAIVTAAGAVVGAVVVGADPAGASAGAPLLLEVNNTEGASTSLVKTQNSGDSSPAFQVFNMIDAVGTIGGGALIASPVAGVVGLTGQGTVTQTAQIPAGVLGLSAQSSGVLGLVGATSPGGVTVTATAAGVKGIALDTVGVGMEAVGFNSGLALKVIGDVAFSTSGQGDIPAHSRSVFVADPGVTANSLIFVTLNGNPGSAVLKWVAASAGNGFTINLTKAAPAAIPFSYFRIS